VSVIWLQEYLESFSPTATLVIVAHDREFIDTVAQEVIILRHHTLSYFTGNLSSCERHARKQ
jgi:ATPase subunit of ABC transporter with duplicated ATPase domains